MHAAGRAERPGRAAGRRRRVEGRAEEGREVHVRPASPPVRVAAVRRRHGARRGREGTGEGRGDRPDGRPAPLAFTPPADGAYTVRVAERFRGRGGPNFVYRLRVTRRAASRPNPASGSRLADRRVHACLRGGTVKVKVTAERFGGFTGPIELECAELPEGRRPLKPVTIAANQTAVDLDLHGRRDAADRHACRSPITGTGDRAAASRSGAGGRPRHAVPAATDADRAARGRVPDAVQDRRPVRDDLARRAARSTAASTGSSASGFDGPIQVRLADQQARHLQGVTGPVVDAPAGRDRVRVPRVPAAVDGAGPHLPRVRDGDREGEGRATAANTPSASVRRSRTSR